MSQELIALLMFSSMLLLLLTGQRVFGAIGFVATAFALLLWGEGASEMPFNASINLLNWYPLLTLPLFIYMGYMLSESGIADDLYRMFHVWAGPLRGGLAIGTIGLMVVIAAMNGLSVAGMAIGASIAMPERLRRGYDKVMVTGVIQAGSSLGILNPTQRGSRPLRDDRSATDLPAVVGRRVPRPSTGEPVRRVHRDPMLLSAQPGTGLTPGGAAGQLE
jgi:TRAP-type mannitol/chloroaromatic compound transport system permease large subunit